MSTILVQMRLSILREVIQFHFVFFEVGVLMYLAIMMVVVAMLRFAVLLLEYLFRRVVLFTIQAIGILLLTTVLSVSVLSVYLQINKESLEERKIDNVFLESLVSEEL